MQEFLTQTFYGNTMSQWAIALGIGVAAFLLGKTVYWITGAIVRRIAKETKTKFDDLIVDIIDGPIVIVVTVLGLWMAVQTLTLPQGAQDFLWNATQVAMVLAVTMMLARLWGAVVTGFLAPLTAKSESDLDDQLLPIARKAGKWAIWIFGLIIALNNAGYQGKMAPVLDYEAADFKLVMDINVNGVFNVLQSVARAVATQNACAASASAC